MSYRVVSLHTAAVSVRAGAVSMLFTLQVLPALQHTDTGVSGWGLTGETHGCQCQLPAHVCAGEFSTSGLAFKPFKLKCHVLVKPLVKLS